MRASGSGECGRTDGESVTSCSEGVGGPPAGASGYGEAAGRVYWVGSACCAISRARSKLIPPGRIVIDCSGAPALIHSSTTTFFGEPRFRRRILSVSLSHTAPMWKRVDVLAWWVLIVIAGTAAALGVVLLVQATSTPTSIAGGVLIGIAFIGLANAVRNLRRRPRSRP